MPSSAEASGRGVPLDLLLQAAAGRRGRHDRRRRPGGPEEPRRGVAEPDHPDVVAEVVQGVGQGQGVHHAAPRLGRVGEQRDRRDGHGGSRLATSTAIRGRPRPVRPAQRDRRRRVRRPGRGRRDDAPSLGPAPGTAPGSPCGSAAAPSTYATTRGPSPAISRRRPRPARRPGRGASRSRGRRRAARRRRRPRPVGGQLEQQLAPGGRVDHRVRPALGVLLGAEVEADVRARRRGQAL